MALKYRQMGVFSKGSTLHVRAGESGASIFVFSGQALIEPIAQYGPFVMNTQ